jgi:hypothetical protein
MFSYLNETESPLFADCEQGKFLYVLVQYANIQYHTVLYCIQFIPFFYRFYRMYVCIYNTVDERL